MRAIIAELGPVSEAGRVGAECHEYSRSGQPGKAGENQAAIFSGFCENGARAAVVQARRLAVAAVAVSRLQFTLHYCHSASGHG